VRETERVGVEEMCLESESVPAYAREIFKRVRSCFFFRMPVRECYLAL
jgi:hypothetical protein